MTAIPVCTALLNPLNHQPDGTVTMNYPAGKDTVASLQSDGSFQTRPKGTADRWEKAQILSGGLLYTNVDALIAVFVPYPELK